MNGYLTPALRQPALSRRFAALALTIVAHLLLLMLLLRLAPPIFPERLDDRPLTTFDVAPAIQKAAPEKKRAAAKTRSADQPPPPAAPTVPPPPVAPKMPALIPGLENFDLRNVRSSVEQADASGTGGKGQNSASTYGPGEGPGGAKLYNAEWYREPTQAELGTYLPERMQPGWGMIACQTIERYRVDNCRVLATEPPGSGLGQAIRKAAWQFMVRPPRIDGKPMIGAWVRIRIDFTERGVEVR